MDQVTYFTLLRFLHICCGVFWAGATIYLSFFIIPAAKAAGAEGSKFMQQLAKTNGLPIVMLLTAVTTVISGTLLIWKSSNGLQMEWLSTRQGMILSTGGIFAYIGFFTGFLVIKPNVEKLGKIGMAIAKAGGPPSAAQVEEIANIQKRLAGATRFVAVLLSVTVITMSVFRYL